MSDATVLDVGCGSGDLLAAMAGQYPNARLAGTDRSAAGLKVGQAALPEALLVTSELNAPERQPEPQNDELAGWASYAVCSEVLEHVDDPVRALSNIQNFLRPGGRLVVTVPGGPMSAFDRQIGHQAHYTPTRIRQELEQAGYHVRLATGAGFPMFNIYRLVVILGGERLAEDIDGTPSLLARTVMSLFDVLLRFTLPSTSWGWQVVAVAEKPNSGSAE